MLLIRLSLALACLAAVTDGQIRMSPVSVDLPTAAEYPEADASTWSAQRKGMLNHLASLRLENKLHSRETLELLAEAGRTLEVLQVLRTIAETRPQDLPRALEFAASRGSNFRGSSEPIDPAAIRAVVTSASALLPKLPREEAASLAFALRLFEMQFVAAERLDWQKELSALVEKYKGTEAAILREVDLLDRWVMESGRPGVPRQTEPLDRFIEEHQGTVAAAKALYLKGYGIAANSGEPKGSDPTERLLRVIGIVEELESGGYPACEWVTNAPSIAVRFFAYEPRFAPGNRDRFVAAYLQFVKTHFSLDPERPGSGGIGAILTSTIPRVLKDGGAVSEIERIFDAMDRDWNAANEVRFLRGHFYMMQMHDSVTGTDRSLFYQKAQEALGAVSGTGGGWIQRKALATLATLQFNERDYLKARSGLRTYLSISPRNEWSWLAAVRIGDAEQGLGSLAQAADAYRSAAERYVDVPPAVVFGHTRAARALEALGDFKGALIEYRRAVAGWDHDYGETYALYDLRRPLPNEALLPRNEVELRRFALEQRVRELTTTVSSESDLMFERGRWLVLNGERDEGIKLLREVTGKYPNSGAAVSARDTITRAQLDGALDLADVEKVGSNEDAALKELEALRREPAGFWTTAAKIARGAILWNRSQRFDAEALAAEGLNDLLAWQKARMSALQPSALEADVVAVRDFVFRPHGDGPFQGLRWEFKPDASQKPFLVLRSHLNVKTPDGAEIEVSADVMPPGFDNALLLTSEELDFFNRLMTKIGGTKRREPAHIMEVPNQPAGPPIDVLAFLNRLFPAHPGHWGGWMFETFPMITRIEFLNAERTRAAVAFTIRYEGATLILEKVDGRWVMKSMTNRWIT